MQIKWLLSPDIFCLEKCWYVSSWIYIRCYFSHYLCFSSSGSNSVQSILQNMFEGELDEEDIGPTDIEDLDLLDPDQTDSAPFPFTLDNVV